MLDIVSMQAEQVVYRMAVQPETKNALASFQRVSLVGSAADTLATDLPTILEKEREALLRQLTQEITSQSATIGELSGNLRATLEAGTATADALNTMIQSLSKLTGQFVSSTPAPQTPAQPSGPPFDIRNYTEALRVATNTAQQLTALTQQLNTTMPGMRSATLRRVPVTFAQAAVAESQEWKTLAAYACPTLSVPKRRRSKRRPSVGRGEMRTRDSR